MFRFILGAVCGVIGYLYAKNRVKSRAKYDRETDTMTVEVAFLGVGGK